MVGDFDASAGKPTRCGHRDSDHAKDFDIVGLLAWYDVVTLLHPR
jgi:hypothetical protein